MRASAAVDVGQGAGPREQQGGDHDGGQGGRAQHEGRALGAKVELAAADHERRVGGEHGQRDEEGAGRGAQPVGQVVRPGAAGVGGRDARQRGEAVLHRVEAAEPHEQAEVGHRRGVHGEAQGGAQRARDRDVVAARAREGDGEAHVEQVERQDADEGQQHGQVEVGAGVEAGAEQREPHQAYADVGVHHVEAEHLPRGDLAHQAAGLPRERAHRRALRRGLL